jgi:hypothetical protein
MQFFLIQTELLTHNSMSLSFSKHNVSSLAWIISAEVHGDLYFFKLSSNNLSHKGTRHINRKQFKLLQMDVVHIIIRHAALSEWFLLVTSLRDLVGQKSLSVLVILNDSELH